MRNNLFLSRANSRLTFLTLPAVLCIVLCGCSMVAPDHPDQTGRVITHSLHSEIVGDVYDIHVRIPPDYDSLTGGPYPVIFQLDVNLGILDEFNVTAGYVSDKEKEQSIPPTIVVGIGYPYDEGPGKGRLRDYTIPIENEPVTEGATGGAPAFYAFIKKELIPFIKTHYPIAGPQGRALFGHSLGGLFVTYAFTQNDDEQPFCGFVAASPSLWFDGGTIFNYLDSLAETPANDSTIFMMTMGDLEGPAMNVYFDNWAARAKQQDFTGVCFNAVTYNTDHLGTISPSFRDGISYLFDNGLRGGK